MILKCLNCQKTCDHTVTKLFSKCTACDRCHYSIEQSKASDAWRELGLQLSKKKGK